MVDGLVRIPAGAQNGGRAGVFEGAIELPARVYVFRAPRSYTREDVVELHIPGAAPAAIALTAALVDAGARPAQPGEFTARAFFSGRIDLSEAEGVADIIDAADDAYLRSGVATLGGRVHRLCENAASRIADALTTVEASIDLADEQITLAAPQELAADLKKLGRELHSIAEQAASIPEKAEVPHVVITGRANVGKSSLLNALTGTDRAIVSVLAGTTRDVLSSSTTLDNQGTVVIQDAAGFISPADPLARAVHDAARQAVRQADVVAFVIDATSSRLEDDMILLKEVRSTNRRAPLLILANKIDLLDKRSSQSRLKEITAMTGEEVRATSGLTGAGLSELRKALALRLDLEASRPGDALGLHEREKRCLLAGAEAVARAADLLAGVSEVSDGAELVAIELRSGLREIGRISGEIVTEDILGRIFARFCVGK